MSTDTLENTGTSTVTEETTPGDHDLFSHYVKKEAILAAAVEGKPATALCGKKWLPSRDAQKFPICPECHEIMETIVGTKQPSNGGQ